MSRLDFWHPVLLSHRLNARRPVGVKLAGRDIALFRASDGGLGALEDRCAHRRMKLSRGRVENGRVICPYHGWSFAGTGEGESPNAPKLHACVTAYDCAEAGGVIWVKARGGGELCPPTAPAMPGWDFAGAVFNKVRAPLQLVIDNFSEIEHTVTTHPHFGLDPAHMAEADMQLETAADSVTVRIHGPAKRPPLDTRLVVGWRRGDYFHSDYTFHFDPPRSLVTHWWTNPRTGRERFFKYHIVHYFVPEDDNTTRMATFTFLKIRWPLFRHPGRHLCWLLRRRTWQTVEEDVALLENLADQSTTLEGMKLSRFDAILGLTRDRLRRIYAEPTPNEHGPIAPPGAACGRDA